MKTTISFYPVRESGRRSEPPALNDDRIESDGFIVVPNVGDTVYFTMRDVLTAQKVVTRRISYLDNHCVVACETEEALPI